jgi:hypothetical protein
MVQADTATAGSVGRDPRRAQDAAVERRLALGFAAALGFWMVVASALGLG